MTPQRRWQIKRHAEGGCIICGKPRANATLCDEHRQAKNARRNHLADKRRAMARVHRAIRFSIVIPMKTKRQGAA